MREFARQPGDRPRLLWCGGPAPKSFTTVSVPPRWLAAANGRAATQRVGPSAAIPWGKLPTSADDAPRKAAGSYLVQLLKDLGYRATLRAVPIDQFYAELGNSQIGFAGGFSPDFPAPSTFFLPC